MKNLKVREIEKGNIVFDNGYILTSDHDQDCCESHYLSLSDLTIEDFEGVVLRIENTFKCESYKLKSFMFLEYETDTLDHGLLNIEDNE